MKIKGLADRGTSLEVMTLEEYRRQEQAGKIQQAQDRLSQNAKNSVAYVLMPDIPAITPSFLRDPNESTEFISQIDGSIRFREGIFRPEFTPISVFDHGVLYGDGIFEGIRIVRNTQGDLSVLLLKEHLERFYKSANILNILMHLPPEDLAKRILETILARKELTGDASDPNYIRLVATRGAGDLGIHPDRCVGHTLYALVANIGLYQKEVYDKGMRIGLIKDTKRVLGDHMPTEVKATGPYSTNIQGLREVSARGYTEGVLLTDRDYVAEATVANIFIIKKGDGVIIYTPSTAYCLPGITRRHVMYIARQQGYRITESRAIKPSALFKSDEVFLTGTGAQIVPVVEIARKPIGNGKPGPITQKLMDIIIADIVKPQFGLPVDSGDREIRDYIRSPPIFSDIESKPKSLYTLH